MSGAAEEHDVCVVHPAEWGQSDTVLSLLRQVYGDDVEEHLGKTVRDALATPGECAFLAFANQKPVGCLLISLGVTAILHGLGILEAFRGRGYASHLIGSSLSWANGHGKPPEKFVTAVDTRTLADRERFTRLGFAKAPFESPPDSPPDLELLELINTAQAGHQPYTPAAPSGNADGIESRPTPPPSAAPR